MNVAFRVDASVQIGTGHLMRCLTLADELLMRGESTCFVSRHMPEYLQNKLAEKGHGLKLLESNSASTMVSGLAHEDWLTVGQDVDAVNTTDVLVGQSWDWLVVDHYALDRRWESLLRKIVGHILVIDDIADREHDCDVLLDQNFYTNSGSRYVNLVPEHCRLLLGPRYALLREEFRYYRSQAVARVGSVKRILVFFGGIDSENYTGLTLQAISELELTNIGVDVVIGLQHPAREKIETVCRTHAFTVHVQTNCMAQLMASADLSIGAGGSATWERCCLGLPVLALPTAENQREQLAGAASESLVYAPQLAGDIAQGIKRHLVTLLEVGGLLGAISRYGMQAVDGRGVWRVISCMAGNSINVRRAEPGDSKSIFEWRNNPSVRAVSRYVEVIDWDTHQNWFLSALNDPARVLLIGEIDGAPLGVVRFDLGQGLAEVSIYLVPEHKTAGRGGDLLRSAEFWLTQTHPEVQLLHAEVLGSNERSHQLFLAEGYSLKSTTYFKRLNST